VRQGARDGGDEGGRSSSIPKKTIFLVRDSSLRKMTERIFRFSDKMGGEKLNDK